MRYEDLTLRNSGYVSAQIQQRIRDTRILVAGCGIGSVFAEAAVRLGFQRLVLADGDSVSAHNLNRQAFVSADVGKPKVRALAERLRAIDPQARIEELNANLDQRNLAEVVAKADLVFDTIDFLDLAAIVGLHDECRRQSKPVITALAVGWGAGAIYFPVGSPWTFRRLFGIEESASVANASYIEAFAPILGKLADRLDPEVVSVVSRALTVMEDGAPCPASQVSPGGFAVGALAATMVVRILSGLPVTAAPEMVIADMSRILTSAGIDLSR